MLAYPTTAAERDRWILDRRGPRHEVSAEKPYAYFVEPERFATGEIGPVATIFLTNRECPWRCAMCDLWRNTLPGPVPPGAIPRQIEYALSRLPRARQIKLYNSGSFFDPQAIPTQDYGTIAALLSGFERVIVECHPALIGPRCLHFQELLTQQLEVAVGLETAHPQALQRLNKRMTLEQYATAAAWLQVHTVALRTFLLVQPPFLPRALASLWLGRSVELALASNSTAIALIATRSGNGAVESLEALGEFAAPELSALEDALDNGLRRAIAHGGQARVFADLWEMERLTDCHACLQKRVERMRAINQTQAVTVSIDCPVCGFQR